MSSPSPTPSFLRSKIWSSPPAKAVQDEAFAGGEDGIFDLKNDGVALGKLNAEGQPFADQMEEVKQQIIDGEITDIPAEVQ